MFNLMQVRQSFEPYLPMRWSVSFSNNELNLISGFFPATNITFVESKPKEETVNLSPKDTITFISGVAKIESISITFYDDSKRKVYSAIKELTNKVISSSGGIIDNPLETTITIKEYDNKLQVMNTWIYKVQLSLNLNNIFIQNPVPFTDELRCIVIGVDKE